jgi:hypothetical protein
MRQKFALPIFEKYGSPVVIESPSLAQPVTVKGFVQPMRYKNAMYLEGTHTPIGFDDGGHCLYIGSPKLRVDRLVRPILIFNGVRYSFKSAEAYMLGERAAYVWGILQVREKLQEAEAAQTALEGMEAA